MFIIIISFSPLGKILFPPSFCMEKWRFYS